MRRRGAISGSALSAAVETGDEKAFFGRPDVGIGVADARAGGGRSGVFVASKGLRIGGVEAEVLCEGLWSLEGAAFNGDLNGVLNGERKGFESV